MRHVPCPRGPRWLDRPSGHSCLTRLNRKTELMYLSDKLIDEVPLAVLDTETTGLEPALGDRVIEIAILRLENTQQVGELNQLVNPGRPIHPAASRVNGLYDSDVADAPSFVDLADRIAELLDGALIVAHNAEFDAAFIAAEWTLTGRPLLLNPWACTLQLARRQYNFWRNSLRDVARELDVGYGRAHRAMGDAWTTAKIFRRMMRDLSGKGISTVGQLMHSQGGQINLPPPPPIALDPSLDAAVRNRTPIRIRYRDDTGNTTERVIEPYYLGTFGESDYLVAYCRLRNAQRAFRIDRILASFPACPG
jgi:DNA polymerase-3 subunit epsilon